MRIAGSADLSPIALQLRSMASGLIRVLRAQ